MIILFILMIMFFTVIGFYNLYGKNGFIYSFIILDNICYLFSFKNIMFYNLDLNLGSLFLPSILVLLYYIIEKNIISKKNIIKISSLTLLSMFILILLSCMFDYSTFDNYGVEFNNLFINNYLILTLYPIFMVLLEILSYKLYSFIKKIYKDYIINILITNIILSVISSIILILLYNFLSINKSVILLAMSTYLVSLVLSIMVAITSKVLINKKVIK